MNKSKTKKINPKLKSKILSTFRGYKQKLAHGDLVARDSRGRCIYCAEGLLLKALGYFPKIVEGCCYWKMYKPTTGKVNWPGVVCGIIEDEEAEE